jgi:hypothetical protein
MHLRAEQRRRTLTDPAYLARYSCRSFAAVRTGSLPSEKAAKGPPIRTPGLHREAIGGKIRPTARGGVRAIGLQGGG